MLERYLGIILIALLTIFAPPLAGQASAVLGQSSPSPAETLPIDQPVTTQSSFTESLKEETEVISKKTIYEDDPEVEAGEEKVLEEGVDGKKTKIVKITYSKPANTSRVGSDSFEVSPSEEYSREIISSETIPAKDKKILRGTKIIWKTLSIADTEMKYWKKMRVYATHYDSHCPGCNEWTATGIRAGKGVIAVDPKVIPLRSKVYIPGYGVAVAGDTGGAIKGNIIDLGFDDARTAGWTARFIDIYLL
ncbi:MAG: N-acetylmuramoyl-L-alanine amidase [Microgenomates group bacterium Gr01-1014_7]|nr:MAG: N-acetylmuramoyl-L-alanine amidase [Microgenomates group bacterium Gr01-1014_7]